MSGDWPRHEFPFLTYGRDKNHKVKSCRTTRYNCIAWAAGDIEKPWWPGVYGFYWPSGISRADRISSFVEAFQLQGYTVCFDASLESGYEKIALYARKDGTPTHAARQLKSGKWTSKLGPFQDIEHDTLECVNGPCYGKASCFMRRPLTPMTFAHLTFLVFRFLRVGIIEIYERSWRFIKRNPPPDKFL